VVIQGRFVGEYAIVSDQSGNGDLGFARNATPGVFQTIVLNSTNVGEYETAEASAYHWITYTRFFLNGYYPAFNGLGLLDVRVNVNATCNAYSYGGRIDLFRSGGGCNNSAFQEVAAHEYGHEFHRWWHGSSSPGGFSEGIGDHIAHFVAGTRVMGRNFHLDGTPVRDYRAGNSANLRQWPCSNCEVHDRGEVWGGFIMDLQDNLISSQGLGGGVLARQLTIPMFASNPADEAEALTEVYLLDDNDASLSNGTPRCTDITAAAQRHSMPVPYVLPVSCGADPSPPSPEYRAPVSALPSAGLDGSPALDGSQLNLWFISPRAGGLGGNDVWTASRPSIAAPWGAPVNVATVSSSSVERSVAVTNDGLTMFLSTNRPGGTGGYDLWSSTRATTVAPWPAPTAILALNTASDEIEPSIAADRLEIVFASNRPGSTGFAIWSAVRATPNASGWDPPVKLRDTSQDDRSPAISDDSTRLTFSTPNVSGDFDLWVSRRTARGFPFSSLWRNVGEVNTTSLEDRPDETSDGFSLYFTRSAFGSGILRADRIQPKMNGPRSGRANTTVSFKLRRDPGDFGYITIGLDALPPTPLTGVIGPLLMIPLGTVASGVHDSNGVVTWTTPVVDAPGTRIYLQGLTQDPGAQWYLSDRLSFLLLP
jgi:hypothetical protein